MHVSIGGLIRPGLLRLSGRRGGCRRPALPGMCRVWPAMPSDSPAVFFFRWFRPTFRMMRGDIYGPAFRCLLGCWAKPSGLLRHAGGSVTGAWVQILHVVWVWECRGPHCAVQKSSASGKPLIAFSCRPVAASGCHTGYACSGIQRTLRRGLPDALS